MPLTYTPGERADFTISTNRGELRYCFQAYEHSNYGGRLTRICDEDAQFMNDTYSSIRVPKGLRVTAFEHTDGSGLRRTYFYDVPLLGGLYNDIISKFVWSNFSVKDFFVFVSSDSQFDWSYCSDDGDSSLCGNEKAAFPGWDTNGMSREYNRRMVEAMNDLGQEDFGEFRIGGCIVNGDLTSYGDQSNDLDQYIQFYEHTMKMNLYSGLGNHDYANNVGDCANNDCASSMVRYLARQARSLNPVSFDWDESDVYLKLLFNREKNEGSLSYSWEIGDIHFVQLNNYPTYKNEWRSWDDWRFLKINHFFIYRSLQWLEQDLEDAVARDKRIILNMHDWKAAVSTEDTLKAELTAGFKAILNNYPVSAIFAGHLHGINKKLESFATDDKRYIPVFISGAAHYGTFFVLRIKGSKMYIWRMVIDQLKGGPLYVQQDDKMIKYERDIGIFNANPAPPLKTYWQYEVTSDSGIPEIPAPEQLRILE